MNEGYSICLNEWALDKSIKSELGLLLIISGLCAEKGYCYASNQYFAELFGISEVAVSQRIKKLEAKNYIEITYKKEGCKVISREIRLKLTLTDDLRKLKPTIKENLKENNTSNNNIKENTKESDSLSQEEKLEHNFGVLWNEYPRKKGKAQAFKHYKGIVRANKLSNQQMLSAIRRYKDYLEEQKIQDQYIMHGSTFFCSGIYDYLGDEEDD